MRIPQPQHLVSQQSVRMHDITKYMGIVDRLPIGSLGSAVCYADLTVVGQST